MRLAIMDDARGCGRAVAGAAVRRGHVIDNASPDAGYVRTHTYEPWRRRGLEMIERLSRLHVPSIPSYRDSLLYDDKRLQAKVLAPWMPKTHVITDEAFRPDMAYPFVSKSARGSASKNVRLVATPAQAEFERAAAFGSSGLRAVNEVQHGYLIWQEFIPGNDHDVRVCVCGDNLFGLIRGNRDEVPFASGSGRLTVIQGMRDPSVRAAFLCAIGIASKIGTRWACFDFVFRDGIPYVLEISFSWTEAAYNLCPCFGLDFQPNGRTAAEWPEFAVTELERLTGWSESTHG